MILVFMLFPRVRQEREGLRPLDGDGELTLALGAVAGDAAGEELAPRGQEGTQERDGLIVDLADLLGAEAADLAADGRTAAAAEAAGTAGARGTGTAVGTARGAGALVTAGAERRARGAGGCAHR